MSETLTQALPEGFVLTISDTTAVFGFYKGAIGDFVWYDLNGDGLQTGEEGLGQGGVRVFVDAFSAQYLSGVVIDYVTSMQGSGFTFTNPNATGGCGCGSSFTV